MTEQVASDALEREGAASMSWSDLRSNRTGSNRTLTMLDQISLQNSVEMLSKEMKRTNEMVSVTIVLTTIKYLYYQAYIY